MWDGVTRRLLQTPSRNRLRNEFSEVAGPTAAPQLVTFNTNDELLKREPKALIPLASITL